MSIEMFRMIERITNVLIAGGAIYFGYRLFLSVPLAANSEGKFQFPGVSAHILRTGPGVFFALFGCIIIVMSFTNPIEITGKNGKPSFSGLGEGNSRAATSGPFNSGDTKRVKAEMERSIQGMNTVTASLRGKVDSTLYLQVYDKIHNSKILLIGFYTGSLDDPDLYQFAMQINERDVSDFNDNQKFKEWAELYHY